MLFSKDIGHGGDLRDAGGGDFTKLNLAWLNWWLKGAEGPAGKGLLVGSGCSYFADSAWEVKSANLLQSTDQVADSNGAAENAPVPGRGCVSSDAWVVPAPDSMLYFVDLSQQTTCLLL